MESTLVHLDVEQKERLRKRARSRGNSFSQEVREAVDLYLDLPAEQVEELSTLARAARESIDRTIVRLDGTIASVDRILKRTRKKR